jgi:hypothetical protein
VHFQIVKIQLFYRPQRNLTREFLIKFVIYALSEDGPRGKAGLTKDELNAPDNLILLCPTHHVIVDAQHETYPAKLLKQWKINHEGNTQKRLSIDLADVNPDVFAHPYFPRSLVDQKINEDLEVIRKSRFFVEFDRVSHSLTLARRILTGKLSGGSDLVKSRALAFCARFLVYTDELNKAEDYLKKAKILGTCPEIKIAEAFLCSQKNDKNTALSILGEIDLPISRTSALTIVRHHDGFRGAIDWLKATGIDAADLDSEGKYFLLSYYLDLAEWEAAKICLNVMTPDDMRETPILHYMIAMTNLLSTVTEELRKVVLKEVPFEAARFPLAAGADDVNARRVAHQHFIAGSEIAQELKCLRAAAISEEYALWLELKDPEESGEGMKKLQAKFRNTKPALRLIRLGLQFGIKLDLDMVEQEIERQIALHGRITQDAAIARFALAFTQKTPEDVANYIARYRDEITKFFDKKSIEFLQIEMLSRAGLPEKAKEHLNILVEEGLSSAEESRLQRLMAEAEGTNPVEAHKEQFKKTGSYGDLDKLVDELESRGDWEGLCEYGQILYERTRSLPDAERLAKALRNTQRDGQLIELLKAHSNLLVQSRNLRMLYCWSLYYEGKLLEARTELTKMNADWKNPNYRALQVNLGIAIGNWSSLTAVVANECLEKEKRSAQELIGVAQLALHLGLPQAKELTFAAADKGNDDAHILAAAYFLATSAGWEADVEVFQWLNKAAALSGDDGPIYKKSLKDLVNMKPDWDRRESETWQLLSCGDIPMFLAAKSLNKSLIHMVLFPALANQLENDPRRRVIIPAYSGARPPAKLNTGGTVAFDATVLLTLSLLNLLDKALDAFEAVHIPHSTLAWLFEEKQRAAFHQPRRIKDAQELQHLLASGVLEKLLPKTVPDGELSQQVGDELAALIGEAEKGNEDNETQHIVVRPSPVHRVSSLMEEEADLTTHAAVLSSCLAIVDKLRERGQITVEEEGKARAYLQIQEKPWSNQPEITDGAVLYLDDLAISYFLHLGILEKLHAAGFRLIASPREVSEAIELTSYQGISDKVNEAIERIRSAIHLRIESGKIKVGRMYNPGDIDEQSISRHPSVRLFALATDCDAIIVDDRFLNKHFQAKIDDGSMQAPIYSTLDLLDALASVGSITPEKRLEYRTLLRRAGYFLIPVNDCELVHYLDHSMVKGDRVIETAELKAIRENILRVRMSIWLQLPQEALWLDEMMRMFIRVLIGQWKAGADLSRVRAISDWIIGQVDVRGWAHGLSGEDGENLVKIGRGNNILLLLMPLKDVTPEVEDNYWSWVEARVLAPIKEQHPDLYSWITEWHRKFIAETAGKVQEECGGPQCQDTIFKVLSDTGASFP